MPRTLCYTREAFAIIFAPFTVDSLRTRRANCQSQAKRNMLKVFTITQRLIEIDFGLIGSLGMHIDTAEAVALTLALAVGFDCSC